ncbi:MAG: hypothetical protein ACYCPW_08385 [Nitrososphaerales archaeon]
MKRTLPPEDLYPGISLYYDLRYGPEGEYNIVKRILEEEEMSSSDQAVSKALSASHLIYETLRQKCRDEVKELEEYADKQLIVGGFPAALIWLTHLLLKFGLEAKRAGTAISEVFKPKNKEDELINAVLKKLEDSDAEEIIVRKVSEISIKTKRRRTSRSRRLKQQK